MQRFSLWENQKHRSVINPLEMFLKKRDSEEGNQFKRSGIQVSDCTVENRNLEYEGATILHLSSFYLYLPSGI